MDDAPDAGFDNGEAYTGAGAESGGIIGMMEVDAIPCPVCLGQTRRLGVGVKPILEKT